MADIVVLQPNAPSVTGQLLETWLARYPKSTRRAYQRDILDFAGFSKIPVGEMHTLNVNLVFMRAQDWLNGLTTSSATVARKASALRSYFDFLTHLRVIDINPLEYLRVRRVNHEVREVLTGEEVQRILSAIVRQDLRGLRDRCIVLMLAELGLRRHELTGLSVRSIQKDADGRTILTVLGKGDKQRTLPVSDLLREQINGYLSRFAALAPNGPLFRNRDSGRLSDNMVYNIVQHYADAAGITKTVSPHSFRHYVVTDAIRNGSQPIEVRSLTGHARVDTVAGYTHLNEIETARTVQERRGIGRQV
jgi:integrase/recombinase XerD